MVIRIFLKELSLEPDEVTTLIAAYDRARERLGLANKDDAICRALAQQVIAAWRSGAPEVDPAFAPAAWDHGQSLQPSG
jgi:hypothetical protein